MPFGDFKGYKVRKNKFIPPKAKAKALVSRVPLNPVQRQQVRTIVMDNPEKKQFVAGGNTISYASGAAVTVTALITPTQGLADNARNGDEITLTSLKFRMGFNAAINSAANFSQMTRVVLFQFNAPSNIAPVIGNMFLNGAGAGAVNIYSSLNIDNHALYNVLYDKTFELIGNQTIAATSTSLTAKLNKFLSFYVPLTHARKKIQFTTGSTNANNQIYLLVIGERPTTGVANGDPTYAYDYNARYIDP